MVPTRPELDGFHIYVPGRPEVWLVYHGLRHHVVSPAVHDALFSTAESHISVSSVDEVRRGPDLNDGTCLVRGDGQDQATYLLTGFPAEEIRRHHITSWETFVDFGFDERLVRIVPGLLLGIVPLGRSLHSSGLTDLPSDLMPGSPEMSQQT